MDEGNAGAGPAGALFTRIWDALVDVLGTATVAALVRRAASRAVARSPELVELIVQHRDLEYGYTVPHAWTQRDGGASVAALRELVAELGRLLVELTGDVIVHGLEQIPELRDAGLVWRMDVTR